MTSKPKEKQVRMDDSLNILGKAGVEESGTNACLSPTCILNTKRSGFVSVLSAV